MLLKEEIGSRDWKNNIRVSQSGCLGLCENGPNILLYPQQLWFSEVTSKDLDEIISVIEGIVQSSAQ